MLKPNTSVYPRHTLRPSHLIETKQNPFLMEGLANQVSSFGRDVVVVLPENLRPRQSKARDGTGITDDPEDLP